MKLPEGIPYTGSFRFCLFSLKRVGMNFTAWLCLARFDFDRQLVSDKKLWVSSAISWMLTPQNYFFTEGTGKKGMVLFNESYLVEISEKNVVRVENFYRRIFILPLWRLSLLIWLVVSNIFYFPFHIWVVILPIDEFIFFKMVIAPPTRYIIH